MKTAETFWMDRLTTRGWIVLWSIIVIGVLLISYNTADRCWPTFKAGSCLAQIDAVTK